MSDDLMRLLERLFSLPNWENRSGPWKDVNDALRDLHEGYQREKTPDRPVQPEREMLPWNS